MIGITVQHGKGGTVHDSYSEACFYYMLQYTAGFAISDAAHSWSLWRAAGSALVSETSYIMLHLCCSMSI